jgi:NAD(P)-dependent dehydrogenase (short-subunit alcohol dehydrogenase family)
LGNDFRIFTRSHACQFQIAYDFCVHINNSQRPLCLVTGANTGIGFEIARGLAQAGAQVVLACRNQAKGEAARSAIDSEFKDSALELLIIDMASQRSIRDAVEQFAQRHSRLDVLVNNAGTVVPSRQESPDGIELTFATNVLGYHLLTKLLLDSLRRATGRVVNVASAMAVGLDLDDVEFKRRPYTPAAAYAQSKQANRMLTWALAKRLEGSSVTANAMTPGAVDTPLLHALAPKYPGRSTTKGADTAIWLAISDEVAGVNGRYWADRTEQPCEFEGDDDEEPLWQLCERMTAGS